MLRLFLIIIIILLVLTPWYFFAMPFVVWYMFLYTGYELGIIAVIIDGYFGAFNSVPYISILTISLIFLIDLLKPSLLMYTKKDEVVS